LIVDCLIYHVIDAELVKKTGLMAIITFSLAVRTPYQILPKKILRNKHDCKYREFNMIFQLIEIKIMSNTTDDRQIKLCIINRPVLYRLLFKLFFMRTQNKK